MKFADTCRSQTIGCATRAIAVERNGQHDRDALRPLQCDRLRDELAEHDGEVREDRERDRERDAGRERWLEEVGEQRLADGADEDGEHGDADLDESDEPDRLVHQAERRLRAAPAARAPSPPGALDAP